MFLSFFHHLKKPAGTHEGEIIVPHIHPYQSHKWLPHQIKTSSLWKVKEESRQEQARFHPLLSLHLQQQQFFYTLITYPLINGHAHTSYNQQLEFYLL